MKRSIKLKSINKGLGMATICLATGTALAVNPVPGFYAGLMLGANYSPATNYTFIDPSSNSTVQGRVYYSVLGNIAGQLGYRCNHYRIEGELLYNDNPIKDIKLGPVTFNKVSKYNTGYGIRARTDVAALMFNGFYDFYTPGQISYFSPYVGAGIGYAMVMNQIKFYNNSVYVPGSNRSNSDTALAGQLILGLGYFLDDFTSMGLDLRYLTTQKAVFPFENRTQVGTINVTLNGSFDRS